MKRRSRKSPFIWTYLAIATAALLAVYTYSTKPEEAVEPTALVALGDELDQITIRTADESIVLEKADSDWVVVVDSRRFDTDLTAISDMLSSLSDLTFTKEVKADATETDLESYGLSAPAISVQARSGDSAVEINFGDEIAVGTDRYVSVSSHPGKVFTVAFKHYSAFNKTRDEVRDRNVVPVAPYELAEITVTNDNQHIHVRKTGDQWSLVAPYEDSADYYSVSDLGWKASGMTADEFVDDDPDTLAPYGLDQPRATVVFVSSSLGASDSPEALTLSIGSETDDGSGFYFMTDKSKSVYKSNQSTTPFVELTANDLLETSIFRKLRSDLVRLDVTDGGQKYTMQSEDDQWVVLLPSGDKVALAEATVIDAWYDLQRVKIKGIADDQYQSQSDEKLKIADTDTWIAAQWKDGTETRVLFGASVATSDGENQLALCKISDRPNVYVSDTQAIHVLVTTLTSAQAAE